MAVALAPEHRERRARAVERPHEVDVHHAAHDVGFHLLDRPVVAEAGIADHDVETAERLLRPRHELCDLGLPGHVHLDRLGSASARSDPRHRFVEPIDAPCPEHDGDSLTCHMLGDREPDAGGGAGDGSNRAFQLHGP